MEGKHGGSLSDDEGVSLLKGHEHYRRFKERELKGAFEELKRVREELIRAKEGLYHRTDFWLLVLLALMIAILISLYIPHWFLLFGFYMVYASILVLIHHFGYKRLVLGPYRKKYEMRFKEELLRPTISFVNEKLSYHPEQGFSQETLDRALLFPFEPTEFKSEDLVKGTIKDMELAFTDVELIKKYSDGDNMKRVLLFQGIVARVKLKKDLASLTVIRPRSFMPTANKIPDTPGDHYPYYNPARNLQIGDDSQKELEEVNLEDPDFETRFGVYSNDQIMARRLLGLRTMDRLRSFQDEWDGMVFMSFKRDEMYLGLEFPKGIFNVELEEDPSKVEKKLDRFYEELETILGFLEDIDEEFLDGNGGKDRSPEQKSAD